MNQVNNLILLFIALFYQMVCFLWKFVKSFSSIIEIKRIYGHENYQYYSSKQLTQGVSHLTKRGISKSGYSLQGRCGAWIMYNTKGHRYFLETLLFVVEWRRFRPIQFSVFGPIKVAFIIAMWWFLLHVKLLIIEEYGSMEGEFVGCDTESYYWRSMEGEL